jgi:hypothetical protein
MADRGRLRALDISAERARLEWCGDAESANILFDEEVSTALHGAGLVRPRAHIELPA